MRKSDEPRNHRTGYGWPVDLARDRQSNCRPLDKARKVTLTISIKPVLTDDRKLDSCDVQFAVSSALPKKESRVFNMRADEEEGLAYNELAPENARQGTIDQPEAAAPTRGPRSIAK